MADIRSIVRREFFREHQVGLAYLGIGAVLFLVFLIATFPYSDALTGVLSPMGITVSSGAQSFSFPFGVSMDQVRLSEAAPGSRPFFESQRINVTPALVSLILGTPGINLRANLYGGTLHLTARRSGSSTALSFAASDIHLEQYRALAAMGASIAGVLDADGNAVISQGDIQGNGGALHVSTSGASFRIVRGMPALALGNLSADVSLEHGSLQIRGVEAHGGDVALSGRGVIEVRPNLPDSTVAIRFTMKPSPAARARLGFLFGFLPHPPNSQPYFLSGTLAFPRIS